MNISDTAVSIFTGAIVVWGIILRYKTINSQKFIDNTKITLFIFASLSIGICLNNFHLVVSLMKIMNDKAGVYTFFIYSCPAIFPIIFRLIKGNYFSDIFYWKSTIFWTPILCVFISSFISENIFLYNLSIAFYFISTGIILGFIHSILGSILASLNIALIVASFYNQGVFSIDLLSIFNIFSLFGVNSSPVQWSILIMSILLGMHNSFNVDWLNNKIL